MVSVHRGVWYALAIHILWWLFLVIGLSIEFRWDSPLVYILMIIQTHLYTGIFITAHDAMHGSVSPNRKINRAVGMVSAFLFSFNFYDKLIKKHHEHHRFAVSDKDPDYHEGGMILWFMRFMGQYLNFWQLVLITVAYNGLAFWLPYENLTFFWMLPAMFSTFQLFYFGTYLPHRGEHSNKFNSRSQKLNHVLAFFTCYYFGYHYEHHSSPGTPWWMLPKKKEELEQVGYPG